ncbi:MAG: response regulator transcription factor [Acidobacteriota bacterium]
MTAVRQMEADSQAREMAVAIVEDQVGIREGLAFLIENTEGYRCTGSYGSVEEAVSRMPSDLPDIVLMDIGLPGMNGIDGIRLLKERWPRMSFVALTVYEDDERIFDALCAGASGYLLKKTPPGRLIECLKEAAAGGAPMSPEVATRVIKLFREIRPVERAECQLTPHESRLLKMLGDGHSHKSAAAQLGCSVHTVGFHVRNIYEKLQVHSKSEAVAKAIRNRLI